MPHHEKIIVDAVARERAEVEAIEASRAAARAGDVLEHEDVMREARAIVAGEKSGQ